MNDFTLAGSWFLDTDGSCIELTIFENHEKYSGVITHEDGYSEIISNVSWDPHSFSLDFWSDSLGQWCCASLADETYDNAAPGPSPACPSHRTVAQEAIEEAIQQTTREASRNAPQDVALYELAAALSPVFTSLPRESGTTGAAFGNFLFTPSIVGPCCPLNGDRSRRAAGSESAPAESPGVSYPDRRCA